MSAADHPPQQFPKGVALLVAATLFMEILDGTILVTALPAIARDLTASTFDVGVAVSAYFIAVAVLIPTSGWMADRFTARPVYLCAIVVFTVASVGCAFSVSLPMLVGMRILQGVAGALMVPVGRLVVLRAAGKSGLVRAIAWLTWPALVAPVVAPLLGGFITSCLGWRWIFVLNVPLGLVGLLVGWRLMPRSHTPGAPRPLDRRGLAAVVVTVAAGMVALDTVRVDGVAWGLLIPTSVICAVGVVVSWRHLTTAPNPLVRLDVLGVRTFRSVALHGSCYRAAVSAVPFVLPLMLQLHMGWSPTAAGAGVMALFAGNVAIKPATTMLMRVLGIRRLLSASLVGSIVVLGAIAAIGADTPWWVIAVVLSLSGALRSIGFTAYNTLAFADVDAADLSEANTIHASTQELSAGVGVAAATAVLSLAAQVAYVDGLPSGEFGVAFVLVAVGLCVCAVGAVRLPRDAAAHVSGRAGG